MQNKSWTILKGETYNQIVCTMEPVVHGDSEIGETEYTVWIGMNLDTATTRHPYLTKRFERFTDALRYANSTVVIPS